MDVFHVPDTELGHQIPDYGLGDENRKISKDHSWNARLSQKQTHLELLL